MHPDEMFTGANFMARISVADKNDLFVQLCRQVATLPQVRNSAIDYDRILSAIREREAQSSTAIGNGVILPHARIDGLDGLAVVVATLQTPLSGDGGAEVHGPLRELRADAGASRGTYEGVLS